MLETTSFHILQAFKKKKKKSLVGLELHHTLRRHPGGRLASRHHVSGFHVLLWKSRPPPSVSCGHSLFATRVFLITASGLETVRRTGIRNVPGGAGRALPTCSQPHWGPACWSPVGSRCSKNVVGFCVKRCYCSVIPSSPHLSGITSVKPVPEAATRPRQPAHRWHSRTSPPPAVSAKLQSCLPGDWEPRS